MINNNKRVESYQSVISEKPAKHSTTTTSQRQTKSSKRKHRRLNTAQRRTAIERETNEKYLKNLSDTPLTDDQVGVISKGLKFIPTPVTDQNKIRQQLLRDFEQFARRMRLRYMFHGKNKEPHPFHVKSNCTPPIQPSVALESYLEHVKVAISEINIEKPKHNLSRNQHAAVKELKNNVAINLKRADKGSTTVILNKTDKIQEAKVQLNNRDHYIPLEEPMVSQTLQRVNEVITQLHKGNHIDDMTKKWLSQTPNQPRIPIFYTLTKIHKPKPVGRPIISGCEGPTEKISSFVDSLLQPISRQHKSYLKDTTDFINFIEETKVSENTILVSMDVTSLYTNIPQEEGITTVCNAYETFHNNNPPIPSRYLRDMLRLILKENSFQFNGENYLQIHGTAIGIKMAVTFANIFMNEVETKMLDESKIKPIVWKRYIDDVFSLWDVPKRDIDIFIQQANAFHPTIKFTAEISEKEITFFDTTVHKGYRFNKESILDIKTHYKPTETFQYTHYSPCHPPGVKRGFNINQSSYEQLVNVKDLL